MGESLLGTPLPQAEQDLLSEYEDPAYMEIVEEEQERTLRGYAFIEAIHDLGLPEED